MSKGGVRGAAIVSTPSRSGYRAAGAPSDVPTSGTHWISPDITSTSREARRKIPLSLSRRLFTRLAPVSDGIRPINVDMAKRGAKHQQEQVDDTNECCKVVDNSKHTHR